MRSSSGNWRGPRTVLTDHVTTSSGSRRNSGKWASHSVSAILISIRARLEPTQRWIPSPNAACQFCARSMITLSMAASLWLPSHGDRCGLQRLRPQRRQRRSLRHRSCLGEVEKARGAGCSRDEDHFGSRVFWRSVDRLSEKFSYGETPDLVP